MPAVDKPAAPDPINLDPFEFDHNGVTYALPSFGAFKSGELRRVRHLDDVGQLYTLLETATQGDPETLAATDDMTIPRLVEVFTDWQRQAGVSLPS